MENFDFWQMGMQVAIVVMGLVAGGTFTIPAVKFLKDLLNTSGGQTMWIVGGLAVLFTLSTAVLEGVIAPGTINPATWGMLLLAIIQQATTRYHQIKKDLDDQEPVQTLS